MLRQIKSAILWAYIWRFRKLLLRLAIIALLIFLIQYFYADVVEYLRYSHRENRIFEALVIKWIAIAALLGLALFFILQTTKKPKSNETKKSSTSQESLDPRKLSKKELRKKAQEIIESKIKR